MHGIIMQIIIFLSACVSLNVETCMQEYVGLKNPVYTKSIDNIKVLIGTAPDKMLFSIRSNRAATFCLGPAAGSATTSSSSSLLVLYLKTCTNYHV